MIIPIFKSCFSIGKSLLTIDSNSDESGADSIINICLENNLQHLILVEDSMTGFIKANEACKKHGIQLIFGFRFSCCNSASEENSKSDHKLIAFAKNDDGCKTLNRIASSVLSHDKQHIDFSILNKLWDSNCKLYIPFYDSFIYNNFTSLSNCIPDFSKIKPTFFLEENGLPLDKYIRQAVLDYTQNGTKFEISESQSIYYKNKSDSLAFQTYKIICNRSFGQSATLSRPNLDHFGSDQFCFENYLEKCKNS